MGGEQRKSGRETKSKVIGSFRLRTLGLVEGSGKWLVTFCIGSDGQHGRAELFDSYFAAQEICRDDCGAFCRGAGQHRVGQIAPEAAPFVHRSRSSGCVEMLNILKTDSSVRGIEWIASKILRPLVADMLPIRFMFSCGSLVQWFHIARFYYLLRWDGFTSVQASQQLIDRLKQMATQKRWRDAQAGK